MTSLHPLRHQLMQAILSATALTACASPVPPTSEDTDLRDEGSGSNGGPQLDDTDGDHDAPNDTDGDDTDPTDTDGGDTDAGDTDPTDTDPTDTDGDDTDLLVPDCDLSLPDAASVFDKPPFSWHSEVFHCGPAPIAGCPDPASTDASTYLEGALGHPQYTFANQGMDLWFTCGPDTAFTNDCCYTFGVGSLAVPGRPFMAGGQARTAEPRRRSDWLQAVSELDEAIAALPVATRAELAQRWTHTARIEHASVASFAAFTLDLLQHGAPADLLYAATLAAGDEVRHAQEAFSLASRFAGEPRGPGPLETSGAAAHPSLVQAARAAFLEGCINETLAAATARAAADHAAHPGLARRLRAVADDEARHAALAWRFVRWALGQHPDLGATLLAIAGEARTPPVHRSAPLDEVCAAWGHPSPAALARLHERTFAEVIDPCLNALIGVPSSPPLALA